MVRRLSNGTTKPSKTPANLVSGRKPTALHCSMTLRTAVNRTCMRKRVVLFASLMLPLVLASCRSRGAKTVVVYVSEDQVFSEPILKDFEKDTGITVKSVFDTEEAKSTGVMNRLIAEKDNPQADVYWANEPVRADVLKQRGVSTPYVSPAAEGIPN